MNTGLALFPVISAADLEREAERVSAEENAQPLILGLAGHVRSRWDEAKDAKRELEERMLECQRQRKGEYDPQKLAEIRMQGGSEVYIQMTSVKCRAATSWLRDTLLGHGAEKPWTLQPSPEPEVSPDVLQQLKAQMTEQIMSQVMQGGEPPPPEAIKQMAEQMRDTVSRQVKEEAKLRVERMERRMEDQLLEGGFSKALNEFLDDVVTFPFGCIKGPVKRRRRRMTWEQGQLVPTEVIRNEWERVDPFMIYWAPWANHIDDGYVIERHRMTRASLESLIGVEGYSEAAIRDVLGHFSTGFLNEWLWIDSAKAEIEDKDITATTHTSDLIDAIQLWDSVPGRLLLDWGMSEEEIDDPHVTYPCEIWLIGNTVIKAVLNYDPLGRKPYYVASYEMLPGAIAGHGVADLCRDTQQMVNAAARSLANNMGISSGPQVGVNVSRLPPGEDITQMYPWKIWQYTNSDFQDNSSPLNFFQPESNAGELLRVFDHFALRADEDTMIPKYMMGGHQAGAARTSSGLSMLISNAGKGIKQVITNIDSNIITPIIERLYQDNLRYADDPELVGDVHVLARGATSLIAKEMDAARKMEFLQILLNSPAAQQITGAQGIAELLRDLAKNFDINVDRLVPDRQQMSIMEEQAQAIQQLQQQIAELTGQEPQAPPGQASQPKVEVRQRNPDGSVAGAGNVPQLMQNRGPQVT
jgi:hypothetical protein